MSVQDSAAILSKSWNDLMLQWAETQTHWADAVSRQFERKFFQPLETDLRNAQGAMSGMADLLHDIRRECE